jgi:hypothetical protein
LKTRAAVWLQQATGARKGQTATRHAGRFALLTTKCEMSHITEAAFATMLCCRRGDTILKSDPLGNSKARWRLENSAAFDCHGLADS